ncbi:hypothetical protein CSKR_203585 [Clonorchis sinensis]|uniref:Uncharacterized protein n=1 Tax=Clonorchis sinensis TaxID=79923 RepID=A0A8T1MBG9_CLOSI|nr:hypothetical protein CSKR_203585 [Clonorchis sinensis]
MVSALVATKSQHSLVCSLRNGPRLSFARRDDEKHCTAASSLLEIAYTDGKIPGHTTEAHSLRLKMLHTCVLLSKRTGVST